LQPDWIVVGAGFTGATFAERMASAGKRVRVLERRPHIAGNAYDAPNDQGVLLHRYGPHIFHTNSPVVRDYLSRFTEWRPYEHRVLASVEGRLVPVPFNLDSLEALFPPHEAAAIEAALIAEHGAGARVPILKLKESRDEQVRSFAVYVYRHIFEGYTLKQWGMRPEDLAPSVSARVPVAIGRDDRYFQDSFQAMPRDGYSAMFARMLDHPNIEVALDTVWDRRADGARVFFTGALDELLDYRFGPLPYRSLRFEHATFVAERYQRVAQLNYPGPEPYTRIVEQKQLTGQDSPFTTLITEYPLAHEPGRTIPYYPVPRDENAALHRRYRDAARAEMPWLTPAGRLADYQYFNMDQACARALKLSAALA
jgi:UDP-galactopyranose mutase